MSTRATIAHSPSFHLFSEAFDDSCIHLQLTGVEFEASTGEVTVSIPLEQWEVMRAYTTVDLSLCEKTDDDLMAVVEAAVTQRSARFNGLPPDATRMRGLMNLAGMFLYGSADTPYEDQIIRGMAYHTALRASQRELKQKILELRALQGNYRG